MNVFSMFSSTSSFHRIGILLGLFFCASVFIYCSKSDNQEASSQTKQSHQKANKDTPELADAMGQLQYYTHKYALALDAKNHELASFYFHEVRAAADGIKKNIPGYEGYDIARFMKIFLVPTLQPIENALANKNWGAARKRTIEMVNGCNSCHNATSHGFVEVTPGFNNNPYNQDFSAPE